ncbi:choline dehydrogenase-like flavoprotein [Bradyrhizobium sp. AZCC 1610]|uniref:GMC family oxidoreductase n=1 Tax=Bradyrhizobium sp. AZCC 1610 TaxID=3117020 RepID=UPI002FF125E2
MIFDFNEAWTRIVTAGPYDVCICGTGPAGITTARKLAAGGKRVLLLEGGDLSYSEASQDLYRGRSIGRQYWHVQSGRLRYFGGTSNHWTGRCGVFDSIDFEERAYFGMPGWPISREQVLARLDEAKEILDIVDSDLSPYEDPEFRSTAFVQSGYALSPPTRFAEKYKAELSQSERVDFFYNANLIDIQLNGAQTLVTGLSVRNFAGQEIAVSAGRYVLALGAIETARLLLNANKQASEGVGNRTGMVGRCFMEHLNVPIGRFLVTAPGFFRRDISLTPTGAFLQQNNIGNGIVHFERNSSPQSSGKLRVLKQFLRETSCLHPSLTKIARDVVDFDCAGDGVVSSLIEQSPNPSSRVRLSREVDKLGLRSVELDWEFNDQDRQTIRILAMKAAEEMARLDRARVQLARFILNQDLEIEIGGHAHQMGTTRMSSKPQFGVVNEDCRVHGTENLYLIGSSVFPTGGGTNPTLTIVLLALRLADHLSLG